MSERRAGQLAEYAVKRARFLADHPDCMVVASSQCRTKSKDIHHTRGRSGGWLLREEFWLASCRPCHDWIGQNVAEARRRGLIGPWLREGAGPATINAA